MLITEQSTAAAAGSAASSVPPTARAAVTGCSQTEIASLCVTRSTISCIKGQEATMGSL
jgi:hypothetical protein